MIKIGFNQPKSKQLRSVPSVILINNGNAIDGFVGFPTDQAMKTFFSTLEKLCNIVYDEEKIQVRLSLMKNFLIQ